MTGLPTQDLGPDDLHGFLVAERSAGSALQGVVGLQRLSRDIGLLRSLAVADVARGRGLASQIVAATEAAAADAGLSELWLLTIDADGYFQGHGYETLDRGEAPAVLRQTAEFGSLCPGDAVLMRKVLKGI